ncbi:unnamed protein product [Lactuca virosa]|uniref:F-box domain-containing protein n=1 Tax=Lactuca virosa TaxID=75947 RepID=A0AAU9LP17_9ASTR|nr:unnamed protein product [Lactuca virosa]
MTRNQNRDGSSSSSRKRVNGGVAPWSDLDQNLLFLVMMKLGVIDFLAFGGVCKTWRSLARNNKKIFMASGPPMLMSISDPSYEKEEWYCCLEDFEGRKFKTILPHAAGRICVGITCGYLILFGEETKDFWLVNLITRHQLHFPCFPFIVRTDLATIRGIIVFSPSLSGWVFVVFRRFSRQIWFSIAGTPAWNHISSTFLAIDLHAFKGKIYTVNIRCRLCEMRLNPEPKLTLLQKKNIPQPSFLFPEFVRSGENLYVMDRGLKDSYTLHELDFEEMKWVSSEKTLEECAFFVNGFKYPAAIKADLWVDHRSLYERYAYFHSAIDTSRKGGFLPSYLVLPQ